MAVRRSELAGAAATVLLSFVPLAPVVGGALAGYLRGEEGLRTGARAGLFAAVPVLVVVFLLGLPVSLGGFLEAGVGPGALGLGLVVAGAVVALAYLVGLSALGGVLGATLQATLGERSK